MKTSHDFLGTWIFSPQPPNAVLPPPAGLKNSQNQLKYYSTWHCIKLHMISYNNNINTLYIQKLHLSLSQPKYLKQLTSKNVTKIFWAPVETGCPQETHHLAQSFGYPESCEQVPFITQKSKDESHGKGHRVCKNHVKPIKLYRNYHKQK